MHERKSKRYTKWLKWSLAIGLVFAALGAVLYVLHFGNTEKWPVASCNIVGSRVVRDVFSESSSRALVMYRGEYRVQYTVRGVDYSVWVPLGPTDADKSFVESTLEQRPRRCNFGIRYNPLHPSEAFPSY
jgi:hypothetical protein